MCFGCCSRLLKRSAAWKTIEARRGEDGYSPLDNQVLRKVAGSASSVAARLRLASSLDNRLEPGEGNDRKKRLMRTSTSKDLGLVRTP